MEKHFVLSGFCHHAKLRFISGRINRINMLIPSGNKIACSGTLCDDLGERRTLLMVNIIRLAPSKVQILLKTYTGRHRRDKAKFNKSHAGIRVGLSAGFCRSCVLLSRFEMTR